MRRLLLAAAASPATTSVAARLLPRAAESRPRRPPCHGGVGQGRPAALCCMRRPRTTAPPTLAKGGMLLLLSAAGVGHGRRRAEKRGSTMFLALQFLFLEYKRTIGDGFFFTSPYLFGELANNKFGKKTIKNSWRCSKGSNNTTFHSIHSYHWVFMYNFLSLIIFFFSFCYFILNLHLQK